MSVKVMGRVWDMQLEPDEKFLLLAMADHADHDGGSIHPGNKHLAEKTGFHERKIQRLIKRFLESGLLSIDDHEQGGRGMFRVYRLNAEKGDTHAALFGPSKGDGDDTHSADERVTPVTPISRERVTSQTEKGDKPDTKRVTPEAEKGDTHACAFPQPSKNRHTEPSGNRQLPRNGPAQILVAEFCTLMQIPEPTNYRKALGQAQQLVNAGCAPDELREIVGWLCGDRWWTDKGIDLGTVVGQRDKWRASQSIPRSPIPIRAMNGPSTPHSRTEDAFETYLRSIDGGAEPAIPDAIDVTGRVS